MCEDFSSDRVLRVNRGDGDLERHKAHVMALSSSLPELMERVRARAEAEGRTEIAAGLGASESERQRLAAFAAYLDHYGGMDVRSLGPLDLRSVLEHAVALTRGEIEPKALFTVSFEPAPLVRASARGLGQVFVSLLINAAQALPDGAPDDNHVGIELDTNDDGWARVAVADSGSGIDPEVLPRIFEPMFSTKRGAGLGIGLAIVREIIEQAGGRVSVESDVGHGTMFIIELPPAP